MLDQREIEGVKTYGVTLDDQPAEGYKGKPWSHMAVEELLDALMYLVKENAVLREQVRDKTLTLESLEAYVTYLKKPPVRHVYDPLPG